MTVLGLDGCKGGWVVAVADETGFLDAFVAPTIESAERAGIQKWGATVMVVDIPIGIPDTGKRLADTEARKFIKPRSSSVFSTPVRAALEAADYDVARAASIAATGGTSLSKQAWAIGDKILEVDQFARTAAMTVREGHPEVSFRAMSAAPIEHYKKTLAGAALRASLLEGEGLDLGTGHDVLRTRGVDLDDFLDAGAMAWTARRVEQGLAASMPSTPEVFSDGWQSAIWY
ncbi:DUF429 domain-containing protein [Demequina capsici]|uniref:DUF429 domain-containing protein n=1 Tax=Demequina capsici TaxID=3075620 RepID=A0AA96F7T1_9MICO|nr:DUF429 domain-containing protein [Demequina sp. OYTSA14]WNM23531.1 DUF429 domain-containing protein [Demequina sp. OYTSA14]